MKTYSECIRTPSQIQFPELFSFSCSAQQLHELQASVLSYGKLNLHNQKKPRTLWADQLSKLTLPKYYFCHFYVIGLATSVICLIEMLAWTQYNKPLLLISLLQRFDNDVGSRHLSLRQCTVGFTLMTIHLIRRVYESFLVERPSKTATMHFSHYLIGVGFYGAMVLGTWLEGASNFEIWSHQSARYDNESQRDGSFENITMVFSILLFLYATYHQYRCHSILASLRQKSSASTETTAISKNGYSIPKGDWFDILVTPHYFADILIYVSLNILYHFNNYIFLCGLIWTIVNLSITANETKQWYVRHFQNAFPKDRYRIIPGCY
ncbi:3-oxo-5-alpha-steroid 4-dehydrogenase-domain-containing protein [Mycotypha africana]|uniref:3-oxo-5-alpha-steroid 4-dehydrogenase-domain-containing protein n=1 Tax=Mycotypha africana TaxID=64632 RepID=UPI002300CDCA|nr:3-oxo-5-alpha-steroid 4-dehydrogenase-domain-containing protein [Mycotypha africana]KAI8987835.1 3-oxo-5-alpha-steroid 4-dehydrogenase-domain-containing protein [Mycotypha africana]